MDFDLCCGPHEVIVPVLNALTHPCQAALCKLKYGAGSDYAHFVLVRRCIAPALSDRESFISAATHNTHYTTTYVYAFGNPGLHGSLLDDSSTACSVFIFPAHSSIAHINYVHCNRIYKEPRPLAPPAAYAVIMFDDDDTVN